jgi:hypothetical protein
MHYSEDACHLSPPSLGKSDGTGQEGGSGEGAPIMLGYRTGQFFLLLVAIVDLHTSNSGDAYSLDPRRRDFISGRELILQFSEAHFARPKSPCCFALNIHPAVAEVDPGTSSEHGLANPLSWRTPSGIPSHGQWFASPTRPISSPSTYPT